MGRRISRDQLLNVATALVVAVAGLTIVQDRVVPALAEGARLDPGDRLREPIRFRALASGETVSVPGAGPTLVVVFKSTCPVCEETAPDWNALAGLAPARVLAVGLDTEAVAKAWVAERIHGIRAVHPVDAAVFMDRLRIRAVPTTLLFEDDRLSLNHIGPVTPEDFARIRRAFLDAAAGELAAASPHETRREP